MPNSSNSTSTKCFTGILCRLLCTGSHPTHPSDDQFFESSAGEYQTAQKSQKLEVQVNQAAADYSTTTPGVVARLMGLESLPKRDTTNLGSYLRSKSVNSIDFISNFDLIKQGGHNCQHRRVRTSVSFREGINDDYGAGGFEYLKEEDLGIKRRPQVMNYDQEEKNEKLQKKNVKEKPSKEIRPVCNKLSSEQVGKSRVNLKEKRPIIKTADGSKSNCMKKKKKRNKISNNYKVDSDQNRLKKVNIEASTTQEVPRVSQSRKPLSSQIANSQTHFENGEVRAIFDGSEMKNEGSCYYKKMVENICMLTKEDMEENWIYVKLEDFEETCQRFGQEILQVLLTQFVDELYGTREL